MIMKSLILAIAFHEQSNWQIGKFIGSYVYTAKGHQYQAAGGRPVFLFYWGGLSRSSWFFLY